MNAREVYARIALMDLPMPKGVRLYTAEGDGFEQDTITLDFRTIETAEQWILALGGTPGRHRNAKDGRQYIDYPAGMEWLGCHLSFQANPLPADPVDPVDEATREQLLPLLVDQEVVTGPAAMAGGCGVLPAEIAELTGMPEEQAEWDGREDPVTGEPLPDGVVGFPAGGRG